MRRLTEGYESSEGRGDDGWLVDASSRRAIIEGVLVEILPRGVSQEERVKAIADARQGVRELGPGASELDLLQAARDAVGPVAISSERRLRKERVLSQLWVYLPLGASEEDKRKAAKIICDLLADLSVMSDYELDQEIKEVLRPFGEEVKGRLRLKELLAHGQRWIDKVLWHLYCSEDISYEEKWDRKLLQDLEAAVAEALENELTGAAEETTEDVEEIVTSVVEQKLGLETDED